MSLNLAYHGESKEVGISGAVSDGDELMKEVLKSRKNESICMLHLNNISFVTTIPTE